MEEARSTVLIVDDQKYNLQLLNAYLSEAGYDTEIAESGKDAWRLLEDTPERFDTVLLDRIMPELDGLEVLKRIKSHPILSKLPVIMQTADGAQKSVLEGLQAGAYYYLTKPYDQDTLLAIVKTAVTDFQQHQSLQEEIQRATNSLSLMKRGLFEFSKLLEARNLAILLGGVCPNPNSVSGLIELMVNAIEHGNLGITYEEKSELIEQGEWEAEVGRRLALPENDNKCATLKFNRQNDEICFHIQDQGKGFQWKKYLEIDPERAFHTHGRGIAMAKMLSFDRVEYKGNGNEVLATISIDKKS
jgi:DNA-binding response OmpR family regulator